MNLNLNKLTDLKNLDQVEAYRLAKQTLTDLYKTDDGKKFVHHLVYAFNASPLNFILFSKADLFDCLTKSVVRTVSTKDQPVPDNIRDLYSRIPNTVSEEDKSKLKLELYNQVGDYIKLSGISRCALRSDHTNKILGTDEYQALIDFSIDQANSGNMTITKMLRYLRPDLNIKGKKVQSKKFSKSTKKVSNDAITRDQLEALREKFNSK